jgi:hypothetical protein
MAFSFNMLNVEAIAKGIAGEAAFQAFAGSTAKDVADHAKEIAPGDEDQYIRSEGDRVLYQNPRGVWHIVEFGSVNNPAYSPLRRAVVAAGLRLENAPKP